MRRALIEIISRSEKRKDVLLLLQDGPVDMPTILETLNVSRNAMLPQMKILDEVQLICKEKDKDSYQLTKFGKLVVNDLNPLLSTLEALEEKIDYWTSHNTDCIPPELFYRLRELEHSKLIEPERCEVLELSKTAIKMSLNSKNIYAIASFYHSDYPWLCNRFVENGSEVRFIITKEVLNRIITEDKQKLDELLLNPKIRIYVYPDEMELSSILLTPDFMLLRLLTINGMYDPRYLVAYEKKAIQWGIELFQFYKSCSEELEKL